MSAIKTWKQRYQELIDESVDKLDEKILDALLQQSQEKLASHYKDAVNEFFSSLGLEGYATPEQTKALAKLLNQIAPNHVILQTMRSQCQLLVRDLAIAQVELREWRSAAIRILCDSPSKNEMINELSAVLDKIDKAKLGEQ